MFSLDTEYFELLASTEKEKWNQIDVGDGHYQWVKPKPSSRRKRETYEMDGDTVRKSFTIHKF